MATEYEVTVTLSLIFGSEDKPTEEQAKEMAMEWIRSVSDNMLAEGMTVTIYEIAE